MAGFFACVLDAIFHEFMSFNNFTNPERGIRVEVPIAGNAISGIILEHTVWNIFNDTSSINELIRLYKVTDSAGIVCIADHTSF